MEQPKWTISMTLAFNRRQILRDIMEVCAPFFACRFSPPESESALRQLLKVDVIRQAVVRLRLDRALSRNDLKTLSFDPSCMKVTGSGKNAIDHNLEGLFADLSSARSARLIKPLSVLEHIRPLSLNNRPSAMISDIQVELPLKVLCVGPRNEAEPFLLWSYGFQLESITSIDLISYSELITLADMHSVPFPDSTFDIVFSSCTLVYSNNIFRAVEELKRVAKPDATFAISQDIPNREYKHSSIKLFGQELFEPESIVSLFMDLADAELLYRHFADQNLDLPNGTTSACIFRRAKHF